MLMVDSHLFGWERGFMKKKLVLILTVFLFSVFALSGVNNAQSTEASNEQVKMETKSIDDADYIISSIEDLISLVDHYKDTREIANEKVARILNVHLTSVNIYAENGETEKMAKHLASFQQLLDYYQQEELISENAFGVLKTGAKYLVEGKTVKGFTVAAQEATFTLNGTEREVWTYNGEIPGTEIRVTEDDIIRVHLVNELPAPVTIHWHGVPVPNQMDGVPGVTQNAVQPGETFTYEFIADTPGTYWYHSHQHSAFQVDKGLFGSIIVEEKDAEYDKDYTLIMDDWIGDKELYDKVLGGNYPTVETPVEAWDTFTINGETNDQIEPLDVQDGDLVKLRFINVGNYDYTLRFSGTEFKITHTDGQPINKPETFTNKSLLTSPGQRYDVEFIYDENQDIVIERMADMWLTDNTVIEFESVGSGDNRNQQEQTIKDDSVEPIDILDYGQYKKGKFTDIKQFDKEYRSDLGMKEDGSMTINGSVYPEEYEPIWVNEGDIVKLTLTNDTPLPHPMHLHGHFFEIISRNGEDLEGSPITRDTILVMPDTEYEIAFEADNPGNWMYHCHKLQHAMKGMSTMVRYEDYELPFTPDAGNIIE